MDKKYLRWSLFVSVPLTLIAFFGALLYLFTPMIFSLLTGVDDACNPDYEGPAYAVSAALAELCNASQAFLGGFMMISIVLSPLPVLASFLLGLIDLADAKIDTLGKLMWFVLFCITGPIGVAVYYLRVVRKRA